jgi:hypothetical protein
MLILFSHLHVFLSNGPHPLTYYTNHFKTVLFFLLGDFPVSEFHALAFQNTMFHLHSWCKLTPPMKMDQSVPKRRYIKFRLQGITQNKNTTSRRRRNFEIESRFNILPSVRLFFKLFPPLKFFH